MINHLIRISAAAVVTLQLAGCGANNHTQLPPDRAHRLPERDASQNGDRQPATSRYLDDIKPDKPASLLDRRISITFSGETLQQAIAKIAALSEISVIIISSPDGKPRLDRRTVAFAMRNAKVSAVLDWLTRQTDSVYVWNGQVVTFADDPAQLIDLTLEQRVYPLLTMTRVSPTTSTVDFAGERAGIVRCVKTLLAQYMKYQPNSTLTVSPQGDELVAVCSPHAHRRIAEILAEIGRTSPLPAAPSDDGLRRVSEKTESIVNCTYEDMPVASVIALLGAQVGLNIGFDTHEIEGGIERRTDLNFGKSSLKFALEVIIRQCGLTGYALEPGNNAVWLFADPAYVRRGRLLWQTGEVRSYDVRQIVERVGVSSLHKLVEQNVIPASWGGSLPAMAYAPTGRLVVFHTRQAHAGISSYLKSLEHTIRQGIIPEIRE